MKRILYFDCVGGAAGDMILASLLALGVSPAEITSGLSSIPIEGYSIKTWEEERMGIRGLRLNVECGIQQPPRTYPDIENLITQSSLPKPVKEVSLKVFSCLADAEAIIHGVSKYEVHFHEVGAVDSLVDIVGAVLALHLLEVSEVHASPLPVGRGTIRTAHGVLPLPAPATVELLCGVPIYGVETAGELVTPTAAALLTTIVGKFGAFPSMKPKKVGHGLGSYTWDDRPNLTRAILGETNILLSDTVGVIEFNIDDMNPELCGSILDKVMESGALDVLFIPAYMKKNRPGTLIKVIVKPENLEQTVDLLFSETTTLGMRYSFFQRRILPRESAVIDTIYGEIRVKKVTQHDGYVVYYPEFEEAKRLSEKTKRPLKEIYRIIETAVVNLEGHKREKTT